MQKAKGGPNKKSGGGGGGGGGGKKKKKKHGRGFGKKSTNAHVGGLSFIWNLIDF